MKKNFPLAKGKYYFNIKSGQSNITIFRDTKNEAVSSFLSYKKLGKEVEWLGKWGGKKFHEDAMPSASDL